MKTNKQIFEIVYIEDKFLKIPPTSSNGRPCIILNDYEQDGFGMVIHTTTKEIPAYAGKPWIKLNFGSNLNLGQEIQEVENHVIDYAESAYGKFDLTQEEINIISDKYNL